MSGAGRAGRAFRTRPSRRPAPQVAADAAQERCADADIVLAVRRPPAAALAGVRPGALVIAIMDPYGAEAALQELAGAGVTAFAMELMPRITRAQVMDVLSSQANLAGYRAVIEARRRLWARPADDDDRRRHRSRPRACSSWAPASPACRRSRPRAASARWSAPPTCGPPPRSRSRASGPSSSRSRTRSSRQAETAGGYAKEMSAEYREKQAALVAAHIAKQDIVITTALIPGRPAPRLVTRAMVEAMRPGSVIVDLAVERGGNVEMAKPGEVVTHQGVKIVGYLNMPGRLAATASSLYARNLTAFVETLVDKEAKSARGELGRRTGARPPA